MADSLEAKFEQLCSTILQTDVENWEARNKAVLELTKLVASYETRPDELDDFTPAVFRAVKEPIKQLVKLAEKAHRSLSATQPLFLH